VILACGGFEANAEMRARYLGPNWDLAKVRGTKYNTGQGLKMALDIGAAPAGHWSGCHAVQWDLNAPPVGDLDVGDRFQKHGYPFGIVVNAHGKRFIDEGPDFLLHLRQIRPRGDEPARSLRLAGLRPEDASSAADEYRIARCTKEKAGWEASCQDGGRRPRGFLDTIREFNAAPQPAPFNPNT
jgi:tricarballylate dehydrogenase